MMLSHTWSPRVCLGCDCPNHYSPSTTSCNEETARASPMFDNLLRSNEVPSPFEECELQDRISVGEAHVAAIDNHVAALRKLQQALSSQLALIGADLEGLDSERGKVVARIADHKRLLSPVRRLSPEVLFKIFGGTIVFPIPRTQSERQEYWWDFHPSKSTLWSIELVCKTWRRAVLDFPELWSSINISLSDGNFSSSDFRYVRRLGHQIARTRHSSLSVSICAGSGQTFSESLPVQLCMLLFSIQDRIESLYLYLPPPMFTFVATLQLYLPILRKLTVLSTNGEKFQNLSHIKLFGDAPLLNVLNTVDVRRVVFALDLPYHQITHYSTYHVFHSHRYPGPTPSDIITILSKVKHLEECNMRCEAMSPTSFSPLTFQRCQELRTLNLSSWPCEYGESVFAQLLDHLVIPRVSTLKVDCCVIEEGFRQDRCQYHTKKTFAAIRRIMIRSQSPLTIFHFTHGAIDEEDLLDFFSSVSSTLQEVRLLDVGPMALTDSILASLVISNADNILLPRLHALHISSKMEFDANLFVDMVVSRWTCELTSFQRLRTIKLCRVFDSNKERANGKLDRTSVLSKLEKYRTEGLKMSYCIA